MKIAEIVEIIGAKVVWGVDLLEKDILQKWQKSRVFCLSATRNQTKK